MDRAREPGHGGRASCSWSADREAPLEEAAAGRATAGGGDRARARAQLGLRRVEVPRSFPLGLAMELDAAADPPGARPRSLLARARDEASRARCARSRRRCAPPRRAWRRDRGAPAPAASARRLAAPRRAPLHRRGPARGRQRADHGRRLRARAHDLRARRPGGRPARGAATGRSARTQPIVMDIFPRSEATGLLRRPDADRRARAGELRAPRGLRDRARGRAPRAPHAAPGSRGHGHPPRDPGPLRPRRATARASSDGRMQGFFHGTGHGLGLRDPRGAVDRQASVP